MWPSPFQVSCPTLCNTGRRRNYCVFQPGVKLGSLEPDGRCPCYCCCGCWERRGKNSIFNVFRAVYTQMAWPSILQQAKTLFTFLPEQSRAGQGASMQSTRDGGRSGPSCDVNGCSSFLVLLVPKAAQFQLGGERLPPSLGNPPNDCFFAYHLTEKIVISFPWFFSAFRIASQSDKNGKFTRVTNVMHMDRNAYACCSRLDGSIYKLKLLG